mgnify:CR=1 FL=1
MNVNYPYDEINDDATILRKRRDSTLNNRASLFCEVLTLLWVATVYSQCNQADV